MRLCCPDCQQTFDIGDDSSLHQVHCPICGSDFTLTGGPTLPHTPPPKRTIGRFELIDRLGSGAFGTVWMARDPELDRTVAVKLPKRDELTAHDAEFFLREARAAAQVKHPNIVAVHEMGRYDDGIYIVYDFVRGITLSEWLRLRTCPPRTAAQLCSKIARALHHAHESDVVHRDLKPGNIMIDQDAEPHILDFGLAKRPSMDMTLTAAGQVLGTPAYMSPEQARGEGKDADRRTDIYSLGVVLFQMLTGQIPFKGDGQPLIFQILTQDPPRPRSLSKTTPRDLETICLKCLEKDRQRRYSTAGEFANDLDRWLNNEPIHARPVGSLERLWRSTRKNRTLAVTAVVAFSAALAFAFFWLRPPSDPIRVFSERSQSSSRRLRAMNELVFEEPAVKTAVREVLLADEDADFVERALLELAQRSHDRQYLADLAISLLCTPHTTAHDAAFRLLCATVPPDQVLSRTQALLSQSRAQIPTQPLERFLLHLDIDRIVGAERSTLLLALLTLADSVRDPRISGTCTSVVDQLPAQDLAACLADLSDRHSDTMVPRFKAHLLRTPTERARSLTRAVEAELARRASPQNVRTIRSTRSLEFLIDAMAASVSIVPGEYPQASEVVSAILDAHDTLADPEILEAAIRAFAQLNKDKPKHLGLLADIARSPKFAEKPAGIAAVEALGTFTDPRALPFFLDVAGNHFANTSSRRAAIGSVASVFNRLDTQERQSARELLTRILERYSVDPSAVPATVIKDTVAACGKVLTCKDACQLFPLLVKQSANLGPILAIQMILIRDNENTSQLVKEYVEWRLSQHAVPSSPNWLDPDRAILDWGSTWFDISEAERIETAKRVVVSLVELQKHQDIHVRMLATLYLRRLVDDATVPMIDPLTLEAERKGQVIQWLEYWARVHNRYKWAGASFAR